jgi:Fic family protein
MLWQWQEHLFGVREGYRTHPEPMQIVSSRYDRPLIFFEAPPSDQIPEEMEAFIRWFNTPSASVLGRAAIAHIYFESIHPFEDGNGRIGRALVEKVLSQGIGQPTLIAVSTVLERRKKEYYAALEQCNNTLDAASFVRFFAEVVLEAQAESMRQLQFLMYKTRLLERLKGQLNARQEKAVLRLFAAGPEGFQGGFSAENYIAITRAPRATATRDLTDLVEKGALLKTGELRYTRYALNVR